MHALEECVAGVGNTLRLPGGFHVPLRRVCRRCTHAGSIDNVLVTYFSPPPTRVKAGPMYATLLTSLFCFAVRSLAMLNKANVFFFIGDVPHPMSTLQTSPWRPYLAMDPAGSQTAISLPHIDQNRQRFQRKDLRLSRL